MITKIKPKSNVATINLPATIIVLAIFCAIAYTFFHSEDDVNTCAERIEHWESRYKNFLRNWGAFDYMDKINILEKYQSEFDRLWDDCPDEMAKRFGNIQDIDEIWD